MKKIVALTVISLFFLTSCKKETESNSNNKVISNSLLISNEGSTKDTAKVVFEEINVTQSDINNEKIKKIEDEVLALSNKGKLTKALEIFKNLLFSDAKGAFNYSFNKLKENKIMNILTSSDQKIRFYSWDDGSGGSWKNYSGGYQIKYNNGNVETIPFPQNTKDYNNNFIVELHTVKSEEENFYITIEQGTYSAKNVELIAKAQGITNNNGDMLLYPYKIFKTSKKEYDKINLSYNPTNVGNQKIIKITNSSAKFAVIKGNKFTNKYLNYIWKGKYYFYDGIIE